MIKFLTYTILGLLVLIIVGFYLLKIIFNIFIPIFLFLVLVLLVYLLLFKKPKVEK